MSYFVTCNNLPSWPMHIKVISVTWSYDPELVSMAANAGIIKAIVSFYCASSIRIRHSSDTVGVFRFVIILEYSTGAKTLANKHLVSFLGLKELSLKYARIRPRRIWNQNPHMVPKLGGKSDNFAVTMGEQWKLELPNTLDGTGSEINSMYF